MGVALKRACLADCEEIHAMQQAAFRPLLEKYGDYETNPGAETLERVREKMAQSGSGYYFIQLGDLAIGAVRLARSKRAVYRIAPMFILPDYQGKGYAQQALRCVEQLYTVPCRWELDTIKQEDKLCHLYEKMGYKATGKEETLCDGMTIRYYAKQN